MKKLGLNSELDELEKGLEGLGSAQKLAESLQQAAALVAFVELAKAYGLGEEAFIDKAVSLWKAQMSNTMEAMELLGALDPDINKVLQEYREKLNSQQELVITGFKNSVRKLIAGEMPKMDWQSILEKLPQA